MTESLKMNGLNQTKDMSCCLMLSFFRQTMESCLTFKDPNKYSLKIPQNTEIANPDLTIDPVLTKKQTNKGFSALHMSVIAEKPNLCCLFDSTDCL